MKERTITIIAWLFMLCIWCLAYLTPPLPEITGYYRILYIFPILYFVKYILLDPSPTLKIWGLSLGISIYFYMYPFHLFTPTTLGSIMMVVGLQVAFGTTSTIFYIYTVYKPLDKDTYLNALQLFLNIYLIIFFIMIICHWYLISNLDNIIMCDSGENSEWKEHRQLQLYGNCIILTKALFYGILITGLNSPLISRAGYILRNANRILKTRPISYPLPTLGHLVVIGGITYYINTIMLDPLPIIENVWNLYYTFNSTMNISAKNHIYITFNHISILFKTWVQGYLDINIFHEFWNDFLNHVIETNNKNKNTDTPIADSFRELWEARKHWPKEVQERFTNLSWSKDLVKNGIFNEIPPHDGEPIAGPSRFRNFQGTELDIDIIRSLEDYESGPSSSETISTCNPKSPEDLPSPKYEGKGKAL